MGSFDSAQFPTDTQTKRRALVIGGTSAEALRQQLADSGYETAPVTSVSSVSNIAAFAPEVVLIVLEREVDAESEAVALSRRLREDPATHALPLVLVYVEEERLMRSAALSVGVDDCFGIWTPHGQILARLDALFWRIEAGRRAASMTGDKRLEIDNFMVLLDAVREDIRASANGSLALIYAVPSSEPGRSFDKQVRDRTLAEAHGFFKLNLRRMDAVGFYGPTTLLVYLPRLKAPEARAILMTMSEEFLEERKSSDLAIGVSSFPDEGSTVEALIEHAEAAAGKARTTAAINYSKVSHQEPSRVIQPTPPVAAVHPAPPARIVHPTPPIAVVHPAPPAPVVHPAPPTPVVEPTPHIPVEPLPATPVVTHQPAPISPALSNVEVSVTSNTAVESPEPPALRETNHVGTEQALAGSSSEPIVSSVPDPEDARAAALLAAARERERLARGAIAPRRLLLTVSDAGRMAQLNALVRSAGYEARTAFDGQQALDLLRIEKPDVVLLDYELRGIDGLETLRRLRKQTSGKVTVPVVLLLPPMQNVARREALELGACGIVVLPYDPAELLDSVRLAGNQE